MAERRMFAKTIIDSDSFLEMPLSTQALYFHLGMRADDDGFVNSPKRIQRLINCSDDDLKLLIAKNFIIPFESGVVVIKHWKIHNYIRNDRYKETTYIDEKRQLALKENNAYTLLDTDGIPSDIPTVDVGKDRIGKVSLGEDSTDNSAVRDEFEELWKLYPRKQGKKKALDYYTKARKKGTTYEEVRQGIEAYADYVRTEKTEDRFIKHGSTFFSEQAWQDEWVSHKPRSKFAEEADDILDGIL